MQFGHTLGRVGLQQLHALLHGGQTGIDLALALLQFGKLLSILRGVALLQILTHLLLHSGVANVGISPGEQFYAGLKVGNQAVYTGGVGAQLGGHLVHASLQLLLCGSQVGGAVCRLGLQVDQAAFQTGNAGLEPGNAVHHIVAAGRGVSHAVGICLQVGAQGSGTVCQRGGTVVQLLYAAF